MSAAPRRPALAFAQHLVDLGLVHPSEEVFAHFDFTNRGSDRVQVKELVPSCGCLQPELRKKEYFPGESGHFLLRVQTANEAAGPKEYRVKIKYEDPDPRETDVVFRVTLPENQVFIRPRALMVYQLSDEPTTEVVEVIDRREGTSLHILRAQCSRPEVARVELAERDIDENGYSHNRLKISIPAELAEGRTDAVVRIYTDDPDYKMLRVPLQVHSRKSPSLVSPKRSILDSKQPLFDPELQPASATDEDEATEN